MLISTNLKVRSETLDKVPDSQVRYPSEESPHHLPGDCLAAVVVAVAQVHLVPHPHLLQDLPEHLAVRKRKRNYRNSPGILVKCFHLDDSIIVPATGGTQGVHGVDIMDYTDIRLLNYNLSPIINYIIIVFKLLLNCILCASIY